MDYWAKGYGRPQAIGMLASGQERLGHETHLLAGEVFGHAGYNQPSPLASNSLWKIRQNSQPRRFSRASNQHLREY